MYPFPGPQFQNLTDTGSAESAYYVRVDQFNTLGLGENVPVATGNANDAMLALVDRKFVTSELLIPSREVADSPRSVGEVDGASNG